MNTIEMWQRVGFLADIFTTFKKHGLSIDLVSTSETNVTVTLDQTTGAFDDKVLKALTDDLSELCCPRVIPSCATVSLVGNNIRTILHHLAPMLEVFEEKQIYLVSQAANDLNLTFVVDEEPADKLVSDLHAQIFSTRRPDAVIGSSWEELFESDEFTSRAVIPWWIEKRNRLLEIAAPKTPQIIYNKEDVGAKIEALKGCSNLDRRLYSIKANIYPPILKLIRDAGFGFECVSPGEVEYLFNEFPDMKAEEILFTPNFAPKGDYEIGLGRGVRTTIDSLHPIKEWPELFKGKEIFARLDPGEGKGHHKFVHTAGVKAKFGIPPSRFEELAILAKRAGATIVGLHAHVGSSIHDPFVWEKTANFLSRAAEHFPEASVLDLGGGLGVVEKPGQPPLDLEQFNEALGKFKKGYPQFKLWIEPGRFLVAEAGVLLARVTQTKVKGDYHFVGVDVGMNTLIRPALYGSHHDIVNLSRLDEEATIRATVVGPICESGDVLGYARDLPECKEGDVMLIGTVGAYGRVMSSNYNLRPPATEYMFEK